jgi:hypothetical protein
LSSNLTAVRTLKQRPKPGTEELISVPPFVAVRVVVPSIAIAPMALKILALDSVMPCENEIVAPFAENTHKRAASKTKESFVDSNFAHLALLS